MKIPKRRQDIPVGENTDYLNFWQKINTILGQKLGIDIFGIGDGVVSVRNISSGYTETADVPNWLINTILASVDARIPVIVDMDELASNISWNTGHYLFVVSSDGEIFDAQSTPRDGDVFLLLPIALLYTGLGDYRQQETKRLTELFVNSLNDPATWQGQTVMGQAVTDVFYFEVQ